MNKDQLQSLSLEEMDSVSGGIQITRSGRVFATVYGEKNDLNVKDYSHYFYSDLSDAPGVRQVIQCTDKNRGSYDATHRVEAEVQLGAGDTNEIIHHMKERHHWKNVSVK